MSNICTVSIDKKTSYFWRDNMKKIIRRCTRMVSTKKGMYITLALWFLLAGFLTIAPSSKEYETTNMEILPEEAQSVIAKKQIE